MEARNRDGVMPVQSLPAGAKMDRKNDTKSKKAIRRLSSYRIGTVIWLRMCPVPQEKERMTPKEIQRSSKLPPRFHRVNHRISINRPDGLQLNPWGWDHPEKLCRWGFPTGLEGRVPGYGITALVVSEDGTPLPQWVGKAEH